MSLGEKDVCRDAIDEVGETRLRNRDLSFRRIRYGMRSLKERQGTGGICTLANWVCWRSFHDGIDNDPMVKRSFVAGRNDRTVETRRQGCWEEESGSQRGT